MAALAAVLDVHPVALLLPPAPRNQVDEEITAFIAARLDIRPYVVHVHGNVDMPDAIAMYMGEAAVQHDYRRHSPDYPLLRKDDDGEG